MNKRYVFFGPQGSGKGTQAELLAEELGIPHIATGDLFRDEVARETDLGRRIASDIDSGKLMPDEDANRLLVAELSRLGPETGYVLDGYPRTIAQAEFLESIAPPEKAVLLEVNDDESVRRIGGRRVCTKCRHVYHLEYQPPKNPTICDLCGGALIIRGDDKEEAIRARLVTYHAVTEPLARFYDERGKLLRVPATGMIYEVKVHIHHALGHTPV